MLSLAIEGVIMNYLEDMLFIALFLIFNRLCKFFWHFFKELWFGRISILGFYMEWNEQKAINMDIFLASSRNN